MLDALAGLPLLAGIIAPVFLIILLGYVLARLGYFVPATIAANGRFTLNVLTPAVVFHALSGSRIAAVLRIDYLAVYSLASLLAFGIGFMVFRRSGTGVAAVRALGVSGSNTAFVGLPILTQLYGPLSAGPAALNMIFECMILLPLMIALVDASRDRGRGLAEVVIGVLRGLLRSSLVWAIALGIACALTGWRMPGPLARTVDLLAGASAAVALVTIGAGLAGIVLAGRGSAIAALVVGKLVLHPLLVLAVMAAIPIGDPMFRNAVILFAALPMFSIFPVFGQSVEDADTCSAAMLVAVVISPFTLLVTMLLLGLHL